MSLDWFLRKPVSLDTGSSLQFLKKDIITANTIDKLMPQMDAAEMINAKAYAMEYIRKNTKEKVSVFEKAPQGAFFVAVKKSDKNLRTPENLV